ncbi:MAG: hypothetical protein SGI88_14245, partial [Candidatus Hydrogenedentes bacterium]|nr:hypothetical protein [Candidatus Hydrogenedentota bacterium]
RCSRGENADLFSLILGGYGLFGIVYSVSLRLVRRRKMQRIVEISTIDDAIDKFHARIRDGFDYGDFQYMTDAQSPGFLHKGVMACYREVSPSTPVPNDQHELSPAQWRDLIHLAHVDKAKAYEAYAGHYRATSGQIYWSDTMQMSTYLDDYHEWLDEKTGAHVRGTEMITEAYIPRASLAAFMRTCARDFRKHGVNVIYGTVRLIERDSESFLAWAREPWACVIFNLHVDHTPAGLMGAADSFRRLIDRSIEYRGSYYLTYHIFATQEQVRAAHPRFSKFLEHKRASDPANIFTSDWYTHYAQQ